MMTIEWLESPEPMASYVSDQAGQFRNSLNHSSCAIIMSSDKFDELVVLATLVKIDNQSELQQAELLAGVRPCNSKPIAEQAWHLPQTKIK